MAVVPEGTIGVPCPPPTAPMLVTVKVWPVSSSGQSDRALAPSPSRRTSDASSSTPLDAGILDHRDQKAVGGVDRDPDVVGAVNNQVVTVDGGVELGEGLQSGHHRLDHQSLHRDS